MAPLGLLLFVLSATLALRSFPASSEQWVGWALFAVIPLGTLLPVMVANAVLRYRLYEIDRVIGRTVSYGIVVSVLGAVYAVGVLGLGTVASALTGDEASQLVVAASVLAVAVLFRPLQARVQRAVDRRFNRTHYQTRLVVDEFAESMRAEASPDAIRRDLATTTAVALQPVHVSVWLAGESDH